MTEASLITMSARERTKNIVLVSAFLVAGVLSAHSAMIFSGLRLEQNDPGDSLFNSYILEHGYQWIHGNPLHRAFWSPPIFWPATNTAAYSDVLLGLAPVYWALRLFALPDTSFQLWMIAMSAANFLVAFAVARNVGLKPLGAATGAYLFAFCAPRMAQIGHQQLIAQFPSVVVLWALAGLFSEALSGRQKWLRTLLLSSAFVAQLYAGFYLGWFLAFGLFLLIPAALLTDRALLTQGLRRAWPYLAIWGALSAAALLPLAIHYRDAAREVGPRPFREVQDMLPRIGTWFQLGSVNWLYSHFAMPKWWPPVGPASLQHEHRGGFGLLTSAIAGAGLYFARRDSAARIAAVVVLEIIAVATLLPGHVSAWVLVWALFPAGKGIRGVARISLLLAIPLAFGVGEFVDRWRYQPLVLALLIAVSMCEQLTNASAFDKLENRKQIAGLAALVGKDCDSFYLSPVQPPQAYYVYELQAMWAALQINRPTVNGYSGNSPPGWDPGNVVMSQADDDRILAFLKRWKADRGVGTERLCWIRPHVEGRL